MLGAVTFGHEQMQAVIDLIISLAESAAKDPRELPPAAYDRPALIERLRGIIGADLTDAYNETAKQIRYSKLDALKEKALAAIPPKTPRTRSCSMPSNR